MRFCIFSIILFSVSCFSSATCNSNGSFVDSVLQLREKLGKLKHFDLQHKNGQAQGGTLDLQSIIGNLYSMKYSYSTGGSGVFLLAYDIQSEKYHLTHMIEGERIPSKIIVGKADNNFCHQKFVDGDSGFVMNIQKDLTFQYFKIEDDNIEILATYRFKI